MTSGTKSWCTISSPRRVRPSKPMWSTSTRRSCAGSTGQPGRQLAPSSAAVTGRMLLSAGAGDGPAADDAADDGLAAGGAGAAVHCVKVTPAAIMPASTATRRLLDVNGDESSPLAPRLAGPPRPGVATRPEPTLLHTALTCCATAALRRNRSSSGCRQAVDLPLPYAGGQSQVEVPANLAAQDGRGRNCAARPHRGVTLGVYSTHTSRRPPTAACAGVRA